MITVFKFKERFGFQDNPFPDGINPSEKHIFYNSGGSSKYDDLTDDFTEGVPHIEYPHKGEHDREDIHQTQLNFNQNNEKDMHDPIILTSLNPRHSTVHTQQLYLYGDMY